MQVTAEIKIRIEPQLKKSFRAKAKREGRSMSNMLKMLILREVEQVQIKDQTQKEQPAAA